MSDDAGIFSQNELNFRDYIDIILRRWRVIVLVFVLVFTIAAIYSLTRPPVFSSNALFIIDPDIPDLGGYKQIMNGEQPYLRPIEFYQAIIYSSIFNEIVADSVEQDSALLLLLATHRLDSWYLADGHLSISRQSDMSDLHYLTVYAPDSTIAWRLAEIAAVVFKNRLVEIEREEFINAVEFIDKQKVIAYNNLQEAEKKLHDFQQGRNAIMENGDGDVLKQLREIQTRLVEVQTQKQLTRANMEGLQRRLDQSYGSKNWESAEESPQVKKLRAELDFLEQQKVKETRDNHTLITDIKAKRDELIDAILNNENERPAGTTIDARAMRELQYNLIQDELALNVLENQEQYYQQQIEELKKQNPHMLESTLMLAQLERMRDVYVSLYTFLTERGEEARITAATSTGGIRIIDAPQMNGQPLGRRKHRILLMGLALGLALSIGLAIFLEMIDKSIKHGEQISRYLNLPYLGSVVRFKQSLHHTNNGKQKDSWYQQNLINGNGHHDPRSDQYHIIRTHLQFAGIDEKLSNIIITSALPDEGKTLTTANLALAFAENSRVLIIDADIRRSMQHNIFKMKRNPGLTNVLVDENSLKESIQQTLTKDLFLLSSGTAPLKPAQIFSSTKMVALLKQVNKEFDIVLIDSPPVNIVADTLMLAKYVKDTVLVARFGKSNMRDLKKAADNLKHAHARIHGFIFNDVQQSAVYRQYNDYYATMINS